MPWNDNANPGPWGSPPPGDDDRREPPRRPARGPQRPPSEGPDLNAGIDRIKRRLQGSLGGPGGLRPRAVAIGAGVVAALWALSGLYVVQPNEAGLPRIHHVDVVLRPVLRAPVARAKRCQDVFEKHCTVTSSVKQGIAVNVTVDWAYLDGASVAADEQSTTTSV